VQRQQQQLASSVGVDNNLPGVDCGHQDNIRWSNCRPAIHTVKAAVICYKICDYYFDAGDAMNETRL